MQAGCLEAAVSLIACVSGTNQSSYAYSVCRCVQQKTEHFRISRAGLHARRRRASVTPMPALACSGRPEAKTVACTAPHRRRAFAGVVLRQQGVDRLDVGGQRMCIVQLARIRPAIPGIASLGGRRGVGCVRRKVGHGDPMLEALGRHSKAVFRSCLDGYRAENGCTDPDLRVIDRAEAGPGQCAAGAALSV